MVLAGAGEVGEVVGSRFSYPFPNIFGHLWNDAPHGIGQSRQSAPQKSMEDTMQQAIQRILFGSMLLSAGMGMAGEPKEIPAVVDKIFIPHGYDDNDNIEVVLHGDFYNSCFKVGQSGATIVEDGQDPVIKLWATSLDYSKDQACAEVVTPFIQVVKLGVLKANQYEVKINDGGESIGFLNVAKRTSDLADDFIYAPVSSAYLKSNTAGQSLVLRGIYPSWTDGCQKIVEVKTYSMPDDVLVVLPITTLDEEAECGETSLRSFKYEHPMAKPFKGEGLMHVRVLNGNSLNQYIAR